MIIILPVIAQNSTFKGKVISIDNDKESPMEGANIALYSNDSIFLTGCITDNKGKFSIEADRSHLSYIQVSFIGYESVILLLPNTNERTVNLGDIQLMPKAEQLSEVVVKPSGNVRKLDRVLVYPSKLQIEKSADGIELSLIPQHFFTK